MKIRSWRGYSTLTPHATNSRLYHFRVNNNYFIIADSKGYFIYITSCY